MVTIRAWNESKSRFFVLLGKSKINGGTYLSKQTVNKIATIQAPEMKWLLGKSLIRNNKLLNFRFRNRQQLPGYRPVKSSAGYQTCFMAIIKFSHSPEITHDLHHFLYWNSYTLTLTLLSLQVKLKWTVSVIQIKIFNVVWSILFRCHAIETLINYYI